MRVLFISLYYPPLETIASSRVKSFVDTFEEAGHECFVLTRFYDPQQFKTYDMLVGSKESVGLTRDYIVDGRIVYTRFNKKNKILSRGRLLPKGLKGYYYLKNVDAYHYSFFEQGKKVFKLEFHKYKFDLIIGSYGPPIVLLLASYLSRKYQIPWIADFRDAYIDERDKGLVLFQKRRNIKKIISNCSGICFATKGMRDFFDLNSKSILNNKPYDLVYNGIDSGEVFVDEADILVYRRFQEIKKSYRYLFLHTGTLYQKQDIEFFLDIGKSERENIAFVFIGLSDDAQKRLNHYENVFFLPLVKKTTSQFFQKNASALLLPVWVNRYSGFSGKAMEYLTSGSLVFISPGVQNDMLDFIEFSGNAIVFETKVQYLNYLNGSEFVPTSGKLAQNPEKFQRSYWNLNLLKLGLKVIRNEGKL